MTTRISHKAAAINLETTTLLFLRIARAPIGGGIGWDPDAPVIARCWVGGDCRTRLTLEHNSDQTRRNEIRLLSLMRRALVNLLRVGASTSETRC